MSTLTVNIDEEAGDTTPLLRRRIKPLSGFEKDRPPLAESSRKIESLEDKLSRSTGNGRTIMEHLLLNKAIAEDVIKKGEHLIDDMPVNILLLENSQGKTALHAAIEKKYINVCKALMMKSSSLLRKKDKKGETPLHYIVKGDFMKAFEVAMKYPGPNDVNTGDKQNYTPVHLAAMNNNKRMLELLIENEGRVSSKTHHKFTPLHFAAKKGFNQCVEVIIKAVKDDNKKKELMDTITKDKSTALMLAAAGGHADCCALLDKTDANLQDKDGNTALHYAAQKGYLSTVKVLVETLQADITIQNNKNQSSLHNAASNRYEYCLTYLLNRVTVIENPPKMLMAAVGSRCKNNVEALLSIPEVKMSIDKPISKGDDTVLHLSLQKGVPSISRLLLQHGADRNIANAKMEYPLHLAAQQKKLLDDSEESERLLMCREILKDSHEIVNTMNKEKQNPLFLAAKSGNEGMVYSLLQKGAKVIVENNDLTAVHVAAQYGRNEAMVALFRSLDAAQHTELSERKPHPLHLAAKHGHLNCCRTLLKRCKPNMSVLLDKEDKHPIDLAVQHGRNDVFCFLLQEMPFEESQNDFGCKIHGYFKEAIADKNELVLDAIIASSWACVVFDLFYCQGNAMSKTDSKSFTNSQHLNKHKKPCKSLVNLVKAFPRTAAKALDKHITSNTDGSTICNYTPFEFIYSSVSDVKKTSLFVCKLAPKQLNPSESNNLPYLDGKIHLPLQRQRKHSGDVEAKIDNPHRCRLDPQAKELNGTLWEKHHPLLDPLVASCKEMLNHKLTKSWMDIKVNSYTKKLYVAYVAIYAIMALITTGFFSCLWNTYHLEARFNGTSRMNINDVYNQMYNSDIPNAAFEGLVSDVRRLSANDTSCSQFRVPADQEQFSEDLATGSVAWNRSVCAIEHLESNSTAAISGEFLLFTSYIIYVWINFNIQQKASNIGIKWFHSTRYCLVFGLPVIFVSLSSCDFFLGLRPDFQWQFGVMVVLMAWLTTATAMNNVFAIFATITKHFMLNYIVTMLPVFLIMYGFALAFHLLLTVEDGAMTTILDTISKAFLWILDEFEHKDIFRQDNSRFNFPATSKLLYVVYGIIVGGLLFNLILMNTGEHLRKMKRKVNLDRSKQSLQRLILADALFPKLRRKYAKCHVTHISDCDHFNSQDCQMGIDTSSSFNMISSSLSSDYFSSNSEGADELVTEIRKQLSQIRQDMESLKKDVRDIPSKIEEKQSAVCRRNVAPCHGRNILA